MHPSSYFGSGLSRGAHPHASFAHMPVRISLRMLSGESEHCVLPSCGKVRDVKFVLQQRRGVKPSLLRLLTTSGSKCEDEARLVDFAECLLADLLDPKTLKRILLEVELHVVVCSDACSVCAAAPARVCAGCRLTRYCSRACQLHDWRHHREHCCRVRSCHLPV